MTPTDGTTPGPHGRARKPPRQTRPADDLAAARSRMESAILDRRKALAHCPVCGALGNWTTESTKRPVRYLRCGHCCVGAIQIAVCDSEVSAALGDTTTPSMENAR